LEQTLSVGGSGASAANIGRGGTSASDTDPPKSLWWYTLDEKVTPREALGGDTEADIAIVGAGYTGLWTAHYLAEADPTLRIVVLEQAVAGFGASGRNGGWCSAFFATSYGRIAEEHGGPAALAMHKAMCQTVDEVGDVSSKLGIDCHYAKGGTIAAARTVAQLERAKQEVAAARRLGIREEDIRLAGAGEATRELGATSVLGAVVNPHCAAIHPARLCRGLASSVEDRSVKLYESTPAISIKPHRVVTPAGTVRADVVVRATEGYTGQLKGMRRKVVPIYSLMIATEPIGEEFWAEAGLSRRQTFSDMRHLVIYGQRTADDRIAFGGRGAPYHFGSAISPAFDQDRNVHEAIRSTLVELFPALEKTEITHRWGGPLGITRDWHPSVGFDRRAGLAWAGGYAGDGVSTTNLAGRTIADLVLGRDTDLVRLPWVGHVSPNWEPEPFRWLGVNAALRLTGSADRAEDRSGRLSRRSTLLERLTGS
jgi:glycine/D-amino acid oxidase-like deaminating enzyme